VRANLLTRDPEFLSERDAPQTVTSRAAILQPTTRSDTQRARVSTRVETTSNFVGSESGASARRSAPGTRRRYDTTSASSMGKHPSKRLSL
jgi:hypothetical protein